MDLLAAQPAIHAGLLSPQGKILFDFFVVQAADGFLLETGARQGGRARQAPDACTGCAPRPTSRMSSATIAVAACGAARHEPPGQRAAPLRFPDPRLPALGWRDARRPMRSDGRSAPGRHQRNEADYHAHRIALGVPEGGKDYAFGDTFPHEALFDQLNGVSFTRAATSARRSCRACSTAARRASASCRSTATPRFRKPEPTSWPARRDRHARLGRGRTAWPWCASTARRSSRPRARRCGRPVGVRIVLRKPGCATFDACAATAAEHAP